MITKILKNLKECFEKICHFLLKCKSKCCLCICLIDENKDIVDNSIENIKKNEKENKENKENIKNKEK